MQAMISIVDDNELVRAATKSLLRSAGYQVETYASAELFLESGVLRETQCLVLDVNMPGMDGLELQRRLNKAQARVPIIFITAHGEQRVKAMEGGAVDFFVKPFKVNHFVAAIHAAVTGSENWHQISSRTLKGSTLVDKDLRMDRIRKEELMTTSNRDISRSLESPAKDGDIAQGSYQSSKLPNSAAILDRWRSNKETNR